MTLAGTCKMVLSCAPALLACAFACMAATAVDRDQALPTATQPMPQATARVTYSVVVVEPSPGVEEHRFYCNNHHFMTAVMHDGALAIRPHPGVDPNGWGSTWYPQPFLPGAILGHVRIARIIANAQGIMLIASGGVSKGDDSTYGEWRFWMRFSYLETEKKISGIGSSVILLDGRLSDATGDLNVCKIAGNYLDDVPLLSGGIGDTGDMECAEVVAPEFQFTWNPSLQPEHFPQDTTRCLSINVLGQYNNVDTAAQGYDPIAAAYKPSLKVELFSRARALTMIFGGIYDTAKSTLFWEDNVGITPLVLKRSTRRLFSFRLTFESEALPGDGS